MCGCRGFTGVIIAQQKQNTSVLRRSREVSVTYRVTRSVDTGTFGIPHCKDTVVATVSVYSRLLCTPDSRCAEILIDRRLEPNPMPIQVLLGRIQLLVKTAKRRSPVSSHKACGVQPGPLVPLRLQHCKPDQRLCASNEYLSVFAGVFVVNCDVSELHHILLRKTPALERFMIFGS
jgi:hypothetical protein